MGVVVFSAGKEVRQERGKIDDDDEGVMRAAHFLWAILPCVAFCPVWWVSMEAPSIVGASAFSPPFFLSLAALPGPLHSESMFIFWSTARSDGNGAGAPSA